MLRAQSLARWRLLGSWTRGRMGSSNSRTKPRRDFALTPHSKMTALRERATPNSRLRGSSRRCVDHERSTLTPHSDLRAREHHRNVSRGPLIFRLDVHAYGARRVACRLLHHRGGWPSPSSAARLTRLEVGNPQSRGWVSPMFSSRAVSRRISRSPTQSKSSCSTTIPRPRAARSW
ncbi:hypothetical protein AKJ09_08583 [Labilithrix luteola]|uniref:Uncharacterized protein n=1 Tax=Labilithrix luteola TaxID=1391654 RepID=A0A0K1Q921_9BACT|nr:hypothetical protein AKJ09_08583 [Labilithrix luteola]